MFESDFCVAAKLANFSFLLSHARSIFLNLVQLSCISSFDDTLFEGQMMKQTYASMK